MLKSNKRVKMIMQPENSKKVRTMKKNELEIINRFLENKDIIDEKEFKTFFYLSFPYRKVNKFNSYLMELYDQNIVYKFNNNVLKPCRDKIKFEVNNMIDSLILDKIKEIEPSITVSLWNLSILSEFSSLQLFLDINIVETYDYARSIVLDKLLELGLNAFYIEDHETILKYNKDSSVYIIKTINEDSPIIKKGKNINKDNSSSFITVPKVEKILVDILKDSFLNNLLSNEVDLIFTNIMKKYQINLKTLFRYAKKKYCYDELIKYLSYLNYDLERGEIR